MESANGNRPIISSKVLQVIMLYQRLESLNGKAPSEACGIKIEGQNKWKTLIQNASKIAPDYRELLLGTLKKTRKLIFLGTFLY
jgi:hypothetical protein